MALDEITYNKATIDDLHRIDGKAELVDGVIVTMPPTGGGPGYARDSIMVSLWNYSLETGHGTAVGDNKAFEVDLPNRRSFSPDAAFHLEESIGLNYYEGAPVFAVEVRSKGDYGPQAELAMARKRAGYFRAGTLVVWDVDLLADEFVVNVYRADNPGLPKGYRRGEIAEAEPAVPGWSLSVESLFKKVAVKHLDGT